MITAVVQDMSMLAHPVINVIRRDVHYDEVSVDRLIGLLTAHCAGIAARSVPLEMYGLPYHGRMERTLLNNEVRTFADAVHIERTAPECAVQTMSHNAEVHRHITGMRYMSSE